MRVPVALRRRGLRTGAVLAGAWLSFTACVPLHQELPLATKAGTVCIYEVLKSTPGIIAIGVYVSKDTPIIEYAYRQANGARALDDLYISVRSDAPGHYEYVGDFMSDSHDPVSGLYDRLAEKCQTTGAYVDQVIVTNQPQPVERRIRVTMLD
jgi:hypothetical protein